MEPACLRLPGARSSLTLASDWLDALACALGLSEALLFRIDLCCHEVLSNIVAHGCAGAHMHWMDLCLSVSGADLVVDISDDCPSFDPLGAPAPLPVTELAQARVGGLGIHLLRNFVDGCSYRYESGRNRLHLVWRDAVCRPGEVPVPRPRQTPVRRVSELDRLYDELKIAEDIQAGMLPQRSPLFPDQAEIDADACIHQARVIGGDFFDAFFIDANRLFVAIGDVCGKGMPAALLMMRILTLVRSETGRKQGHKGKLDVVVERINRSVCAGNDKLLFSSLFCGLIDLSSGQFRYVSAGHNPPAFASEGEPFEWLNGPRNPVLGVAPERSYRMGQGRFAAGDTLFLYTDGVTEAMNPVGDCFGEARLLAALDASLSRQSGELIAAVLEAVETFCSGRSQSDDITVLAIRHPGRCAT